MRMKFDARRPIAILMAALLFALCLMPTGFGAKPLLTDEAYAGEIHVLADNESFTSVSGGSSPFSVDTSWRHYRSDGAPAYCRQKGLNNPDGTSGSYWIDAQDTGQNSPSEYASGHMQGGARSAAGQAAGKLKA
ncbi:MAG: hypothetical protein LBS91_00925, partial [Clostridiales Family XIII bacterium]|nr:hypothetical protein [Clostridiales Family XIII bacterium]